MGVKTPMLAKTEPSETKIWAIAAEDNVAVALQDVAAGEALTCDGEAITAKTAIPKGHKIARRAIAADENVVKYGFSIGRATKAIGVGEHVHTHNVQTLLKGVDHLNYEPKGAHATPPAEARMFKGYRRADGRVGIRNEIWVIPTVGCVAKAAENIAAAGHAKAYPGVDGVYALPHPFGCSQLGDDLRGTRAILASLAAHPNVGGVIFIGLGCESNQLSALLDSTDAIDKTRMRTIIAQQAEDELSAGAEAVAELAGIMASDSREDCPASELVIGVKCGGSDGFSGFTANPLTGLMTDRVAAAGGMSILTEIPEIFGAEQVLAGRCVSQEVFDAFDGVIRDFRQYFIDQGEPISENPSPGNIEGGITTLEEKSLGAVQKAGRDASVTDVVRYGGRAVKKGLTILEAPGNDAVSCTALAAAGAQIILFTTGRGTPLGFPAPTIKIASNSGLATRKPNWVDFNAGALMDGATQEETADKLFDLIVDVAGGAQTRNEINGERSIAIWKRGVTL